jgi:hypothetical protein
MATAHTTPAPSFARFALGASGSPYLRSRQIAVNEEICGISVALRPRASRSASNFAIHMGTLAAARPMLGPLLASDLAAAAGAAFTAAPLVAVIDEAITLSAAGKKGLWKAIGDKLAAVARSPISFFGSVSFLWLWAVYALTYATANTVETIAKAAGANPATPVLLCSTAANLGICLMKDAAFARMYGGSSDKKDDDAKKTTGLSSKVLALWAGRDALTQFFVFTMPVLLSGRVPDLVTRLSAPVMAQYFTTPLHLLGIRLFSLPLGTTIASQWAPVQAILFQTVIARQIRIFPAFSVAGVVNQKLRRMVIEMLVKAKSI